MLTNNLVIPVILGLLATNVATTNTVFKPDEKAPEITITNNEPYVIEGDDFNVEDYIEVNGKNTAIIAVGEINTNVPGDYTLDIYAVDKEGNTSSTTLDIEVVSKEVYENYRNSHDNFMYARSYRTTQEMNDALAAFRTLKNATAYELAQKYIGMPGDCFTVASTFINELYEGKGSIKNIYQISPEEIQPGDIIYYYDGGLGDQHWAVYLGGSYALQGNFLGTTIIGNVYLTGASDPIFYRVYLAD